MLGILPPPTLALPPLLTDCGIVGGGRAPTVARGHVGQIVSASSSIGEGRSVLGHANDVLDGILAANREVVGRARSGDFPRRSHRCSGGTSSPAATAAGVVVEAAVVAMMTVVTTMTEPARGTGPARRGESLRSADPCAGTRPCRTARGRTETCR